MFVAAAKPGMEVDALIPRRGERASAHGAVESYGDAVRNVATINSSMLRKPKR